ncbi:hypothetical protein C8R45DRAFT_1101722 [Mycena sanguinolenta]|nr:hypothetical protein C8R45DRAFT_1101722 [Mycena sanguinolenta]
MRSCNRKWEGKGDDCGGVCGPGSFRGVPSLVGTAEDTRPRKRQSSLCSDVLAAGARTQQRQKLRIQKLEFPSLHRDAAPIQFEAAPALERGGKTYAAGLWADGASREAGMDSLSKRKRCLEARLGVVLFQKLQDGSQFVQGLLQIQYPKSKTTRRMLISDASNVV